MQTTGSITRLLPKSRKGQSGQALRGFVAIPASSQYYQQNQSSTQEGKGMAIPDYQTLMRPVLVTLETHGDMSLPNWLTC